MNFGNSVISQIHYNFYFKKNTVKNHWNIFLKTNYKQKYNGKFEKYLKT